MSRKFLFPFLVAMAIGIASCSSFHSYERTQLETVAANARREVLVRFPDLDQVSKAMVETNQPAIAYYQMAGFSHAQFSIKWLISSNRYVGIGGQGNMLTLQGESITAGIYNADPETQKRFERQIPR